ncbi:MAG TPA: hypothetical protein VK654_13330 [Nitrospirota bacterium]|nr:hypothetical protein [Nitrospirota bacterium]
MKKTAAVLFIVAVFCLAALCGTAGAEEKVIGTVKSIDLATNTVVVKSYTGQDVPIVISPDDTATIKKLVEKRIRVDDDIKVKYEVRDGKNVATYFKKPVGC